MKQDTVYVFFIYDVQTQIIESVQKIWPCVMLTTTSVWFK
jgi:hypothetical protein